MKQLQRTTVIPIVSPRAAGAGNLEIARSSIVALLGLLALATPARADSVWVLWGGSAGKEAAGTRLSVHRTLAECLEERKSWEEKQRAYLRAANESRPQDQLSPVPADSYRCLPDTSDPKAPKGSSRPPRHSPA